MPFQKPSRSKDGVMRSSVRVEFRIELGACILAAVEEMEDGAPQLRRGAIEARIRDRLKDGGNDWIAWGAERTAHWEEDTYEEFVDELTPEVEKLFPEFLQ